MWNRQGATSADKHKGLAQFFDIEAMIYSKGGCFFEEERNKK
jgi:hypothetical protein